MTNGNDRLDRIERILEQVAISQHEASKNLQETAARQEEMAARQQYHDEAHDRHDAKITQILQAIEIDAENIRALARVAEAHERRLDDIEGADEH